MKIYLFMCLNDVIGDTYYTDKEEVEKLVKMTNAEYGKNCRDFWYKELINNADKPKTAKYQVSFYFGRWTANRFVKPDKIVEVELLEDTTENKIIEKALGLIGEYPKTYSAFVVRIG